MTSATITLRSRRSLTKTRQSIKPRQTAVPIHHALPAVNKTHFILLMLLLLVPVPFYWNVMFHAGILHDDEVCCVNLTRMDLRSMYHWIGYDSYPLLYPLLLKAYAIVFGYSDMAFRLCGFLMQLFIMGSVGFFCISARTLPRFTLPLLLLLPAFINFTSNMRAWGFGIGLLILLYALLIQEKRNDWAVGLVAFLACQATYHNCIMLFSLFLPVIVLFKDWKLLVIGAICALSMCIYIPAVAGESSHYQNIHVHYGLHDFFEKLNSADCRGENRFLVFFGVLNIADVLITSKIRALRFELSLMAIAFLCYFAFLCKLQYTTSEYYYLPLIAVICLTLDKMFAFVPDKTFLKHPKTYLYCAAICLLIPTSFAASKQPQTNIGDSLKFLQANVRSNDLVIVSPWQTTLEVEYYLSGNGNYEMLSVPPGLTNNLLMRFDLETQYISKHPEPEISFVKSRIEKAVREKQRVFIVSNMDWRQMHQPAPALAQLKASIPNVSNSFYYSFIMNEQLMNYVQGLLLSSPPQPGHPYSVHGNLVVLNDY